MSIQTFIFAVDNSKLNNMELKKVRHLLPKNGMKIIAERTGIPYTEVTRMFKGLETKRTGQIVEATAKYLEELQAETTKAAQQFQSVLS